MDDIDELSLSPLYFRKRNLPSFWIVVFIFMFLLTYEQDFWNLEQDEKDLTNDYFPDI